MITSVENMIEFIELNNLRHWKVTTSDSENHLIFETSNKERYSERIERFRKVMNLLSSYRLIFFGRKEYNQSRGIYREEFINKKNLYISITDIEEKLNETRIKMIIKHK